MRIDNGQLTVGEAANNNSSFCDIFRRMTMEKEILVIGIAGGTGSGKTTLMQRLVENSETMLPF